MGRKLTPLRGRQFNRLSVEKWTTGPGFKGNRWMCTCSCGSGKVLYLKTAQLTSGNTSSCGCYNLECVATRNTTHGEAGRVKTTTYKRWKSMNDRCNKKAGPTYLLYAARGIKVCRRWRKYENFLADMKPCPAGCSLDRINNNRGYCKSNCRWATAKVQNGNKSNTIKVRYRNRVQAMGAWATELGLNYQTCVDRWHRGDRGGHLFRQPRKKKEAK